jgi:hypothetical protein
MLNRRDGLGRPQGSYGGVALALRDAAVSGPAPVRVLCERAQVGYAAGRYTASRLVAAGQLVPVRPGRPMVLALPPAGEELADYLDALHRSFWDQPSLGDCDDSKAAAT